MTASSAAPVAAVIVLAAGGGTRMKSARSKLLHEIAGRSLLSYALGAATGVEPQHLVVVTGHLREQVEAHLTEIAPDASLAVQEEQLGTGHAVQCGLAGLNDLTGEIIVTYGDVPMLTGKTLRELVDTHRRSQDAITVLTARLDDPTGYGRVMRDDVDQVTGIVEHKDASAKQRSITEINSGIYVFDAQTLRDGLAKIRTDNAQGELYLTDVIGVTRAQGARIGAHVVDDLWQTEGINDRVQLARMNAEMNRRICQQWMLAGVTIVDPATTWIHASVDLGTDVTLLPGTSLEGATSVADGVTIGPDTTLKDVEIGARASVVRTHGSLATIGADASVGPFAYLRPGTVLGESGKIGTFVETKNAQIGAGAKVPHLTYAGDVIIDDGANIGAGTIFANYDGVTKATTRVGRHSFVGSNSVLAAPVTIADGAYIAAGSTVTSDVDSGELAVARARQRNVAGWVGRKRPGTRTAEAAAAGEPDPGPAEAMPDPDTTVTRDHPGRADTAPHTEGTTKSQDQS